MTLTEVTRAAAFAPGHITGFFHARDDVPEVARRGSRGAGVCLAMGAATVVTLTPAPRFTLETTINGEEVEAPVTRDAVVPVLKEAVREMRIGLDRANPPGERAMVHARVDTRLDLPEGQGLGMSAAGALSSALATAKAVRLGRSVAVAAAHAAEVENRTGLGDVMGALHGGFEVRTAAGIPPWGATQSFLGYGDIVLAVVGDPVSTRDVLADPTRRWRVDEVGARCMERFLAAPGLEAFMTLSRTFAEETGLVTDAVAEALAACDAVPDTLAAQCMLGNSVFAIGDTARLTKALEPHGPVVVSPVDPDGARHLVVESSSESDAA